MAVLTLILGESGTGKSASLRNFLKDEIAYINVSKKPLPFRGLFKQSLKTSDALIILKAVRTCQNKIIVIDDAQYIMGFDEMARRNEKGYQKFTDIGGEFFDIVDAAKNLPDDVRVYFLMHVETTSEGIIKAKTSGQMLDKKITLEGMFTTVLRTCVKDGQYFFSVHNSGSDTVKSPIGMFDSDLIENDLKAVDKAQCEYYEIVGDC